MAKTPSKRSLLPVIDEFAEDIGLCPSHLITPKIRDLIYNDWLDNYVFDNPPVEVTLYMKKLRLRNKFKRSKKRLIVFNDLTLFND